MQAEGAVVEKNLRAVANRIENLGFVRLQVCFPSCPIQSNLDKFPEAKYLREGSPAGQHGRH